MPSKTNLTDANDNLSDNSNWNEEEVSVMDTSSTHVECLTVDTSLGGASAGVGGGPSNDESTHPVTAGGSAHSRGIPISTCASSGAKGKNAGSKQSGSMPQRPNSARVDLDSLDKVPEDTRDLILWSECQTEIEQSQSS